MAFVAAITNGGTTKIEALRKYLADWANELSGALLDSLTIRMTANPVSRVSNGAVAAENSKPR